ncbi:MAG: UDP-glucose/GDP-mannose dehydrogenase family protein [Acidobacteriota bacterium]|nr:UDP-glucose/GDP-mannose dehydrogenase family protein [Blastocatellia bacterium]MDW8239306.1 UDP-glucose/GDP-mannose dehydrogenase family protein [Acidobacteriota bacterium]
MANVCVIGAGHVGLVSAACFAKLGHQVIAVDKNEERIRQLHQGRSPFYEPGLDELLHEAVAKQRLMFSTDVADGVNRSEIIFICVGTPPMADGGADLSQVEEVARMVAHTMTDYKLIVEKSTVPVKTSQWIKRTVGLFKRSGVEFDVASNPEFLREGTAIKDFMEPDRIVIGVESERAKALMLKLYEGFNCPVLVTDINTAEIIKHASNSFLAMKISFINMIADLCERTGADVQMVAEGMGYDRRIGRSFLNAGAGYGGSCFPKDVKAFAKIAEDLGLNFELLKEVDRINESRVGRLMERLKEALWMCRNKTIGVLGLAFKPDTDDIRESVSLKVIRQLLDQGARLKLYDAKAAENMKREFPPQPDIVQYVDSPYEAARDAEALLILTEWDEFKHLDLPRVKTLMRTPIIVDGRNVFDPARVRELGFEYYCMGRQSVRNHF